MYKKSENAIFAFFLAFSLSEVAEVFSWSESGSMELNYFFIDLMNESGRFSTRFIAAMTSWKSQSRVLTFMEALGILFASLPEGFFLKNVSYVC